MQDEWRTYWSHMLYFLRLWPLGIPISLIPFAIDVARPGFQGNVLLRLGISLSYGLIIPLVVWCWYAAVFAVITRAHGSRPFTPPMSLHLLCMTGGMVSGIALTMLFNRAAFGVAMRMIYFVPALLFGCLVTAFFTFYVASMMVAGGVFFEQSFGSTYLTGMMIVAGVTLAYTLFGGFLGASLTDVVQGVIMLMEDATET